MPNSFWGADRFNGYISTAGGDTTGTICVDHSSYNIIRMVIPCIGLCLLSCESQTQSSNCQGWLYNRPLITGLIYILCSCIHRLCRLLERLLQ